MDRRLSGNGGEDNDTVVISSDGEEGDIGNVEDLVEMLDEDIELEEEVIDLNGMQRLDWSSDDDNSTVASENDYELIQENRRLSDRIEFLERVVEEERNSRHVVERRLLLAESHLTPRRRARYEEDWSEDEFFHSDRVVRRRLG